LSRSSSADRAAPPQPAHPLFPFPLHILKTRRPRFPRPSPTVETRPLPAGTRIQRLWRKARTADGTTPPEFAGLSPNVFPQRKLLAPDGTGLQKVPTPPSPPSPLSAYIQRVRFFPRSAEERSGGSRYPAIWRWAGKPAHRGLPRTRTPYPPSLRSIDAPCGVPHRVLNRRLTSLGPRPPRRWARRSLNPRPHPPDPSD